MTLKIQEFRAEKLINSGKILLIAAVVSISLYSCKGSTEAENLKEAKEDVVDATQELSEARKDSIVQYASYRVEMDKRLIENDKNIALIRANIKKQKASIRMQLEKDLDVLMEKNEAFRTAIKNNQDGIYSKWETFKTDLNTNMDDLGKSISEMANKNK